MTQPFHKPTLQPATPCWIVRQPAGEDAIEIVYIGLANRIELDAHIERLARWPWHLDDHGSVTVLADAKAEAIGVRIEHPSQNADVILRQVESLFGTLVYYACRAATWHRLENGGRP